MSNRIICVLVLVGSLYGLALLPQLAFAQQPKPPTLCVDGASDCDAVTPTPSTKIKWHPGHYVKTQGNHCRDQRDYFDGILRNLTKYVESSDKFVGALVAYGWGALERDRRVYNWSRVHADLNWLAAKGKQLIVVVETKCFRGDNPEWLVPNNLETLGDGYESYGSGISAALWREHVMNQAIGFWRAFAAEFDGHPNLEMVSFGSESCPSWGQREDGPPTDYSHLRALNQQIRLYDAMTDAFHQTNVFAPWNCYQGGTAVDGVEALYQRGMGRAGPDLCVDPGYQVFIGENGAIRDYRGAIPHRPIVSAPNLGGKDDIMPLSNIQRCIDTGAVTHMPWVLSTRTTPGATKVDIIHHIETPGNDVYKACPTRYTEIYGGCQ